MNRVIQTFKNYFKDPDTNIFRNYVDALLGTIILIVLPALSLLSLITILGDASLLNYVFPLTSICLAGAYDTYGRYESHSPKNIKLAIRLIGDFIAIILSLIAIANQNYVLTILAPIVLIVPGLMICHEVYYRVKTAIMISKWYAN